jgi:hypothetical protein
MTPKKNPPTLDEFRAQMRAEMQAAAEQLAELYFSGSLDELPPRRRQKRTKRMPFLPGMEPGNGGQ